MNSTVGHLDKRRKIILIILLGLAMFGSFFIGYYSGLAEGPSNPVVFATLQGGILNG